MKSSSGDLRPTSPELSGPSRNLSPPRGKSLPGSRESSPAPEAKSWLKKVTNRKSSAGSVQSSSSESLKRQNSGQDLYDAVLGSSEMLGQLLIDPGTIVNFQNKEHSMFTPLHNAAKCNLVDIVRRLIARQDIDVNLASNDGYTPFLLACRQPAVDCVRVLLRDFRLDLDKADSRGLTPLWYAASDGHLQVVQEMIASGRRFTVTKISSEFHKFDVIPVAAARANNHTQVVELLEKFEKDPEATRALVRVEIGYKGSPSFFLFPFIPFEFSSGLRLLFFCPPPVHFGSSCSCPPLSWSP